MPRPRRNLIGQKFGFLTVLDGAGKDAKGRLLYRCQCDCGNVTTARAGHITYGQTTSCGCRNGMRSIKASGGHRVTDLPEYGIWRGMVRRCRVPKAKDYSNYGGRGVKVCERWTSGEGVATGFLCFLADMGPRPSPQHTLDRTDNDSNYQPGNVTWKLNIDQQQNRRITRRVVADGENMSLADACRKFGISYNRARKRIERGATIQAAFEATLEKARQ